MILVILVLVPYEFNLSNGAQKPTHPFLQHKKHTSCRHPCSLDLVCNVSPHQTSPIHNTDISFKPGLHHWTETRGFTRRARRRARLAAPRQRHVSQNQTGSLQDPSCTVDPAASLVLRFTNPPSSFQHYHLLLLLQAVLACYPKFRHRHHYIVPWRLPQILNLLLQQKTPPPPNRRTATKNPPVTKNTLCL